MVESGNAMNVLIIEEDAELFGLIRDQLEQINPLNIELHHLISWRDAFNYVESSDDDLAIIGYNHDTNTSLDYNHLNAVRRLREIKPELPILMITSNGEEQLVLKALKSGNDDYLKSGCDDYLPISELSPDSLLNAMKYSIEHRKQLRELKLTAKIDGLTKLCNREHMMNKLENEMKDAIRHNRNLFVSMIDLDDFKDVNDRNGHLSGDKVLKQTAEIIRQEIRAGDTAGRYGGDEFLLLIADTDSEGARTTLERILNNIEKKRFELPEARSNENANHVHLTGSAGITEFQGSNWDNFESSVRPQDLINRADRSLYLAKKKGGNRVERRKYERIPVKSGSLKIKYDDAKHKATLLDYSKKGLRLRFSPNNDFTETITVYFQTQQNQSIEKGGNIEWYENEPNSPRVTVGVKVSVPTEHFVPNAERQTQLNP